MICEPGCRSRQKAFTVRFAQEETMDAEVRLETWKECLGPAQEIRCCIGFACPQSEPFDAWSGIRSMAMVQAIRHADDGVTSEKRRYIRLMIMLLLMMMMELRSARTRRRRICRSGAPEDVKTCSGTAQPRWASHAPHALSLCMRQRAVRGNAYEYFSSTYRYFLYFELYP